MTVRGGRFHEFQAALAAEWPAPFVDCAFLLERILAGEAPMGPTRPTALRFAPVALEKIALRGQFQRPHVPKAEVLVTHFPGGQQYAGFLAPVAAELRRRGRTVAVALPPRPSTLPGHYGAVPTFPLGALADPAAYGRARAAYWRLRPHVRAFSTRHALTSTQRAHLSIALQAYCWQRELARAALAATGARVVFGLHFMLDAGIRGAIREPGGGARPRTLVMQHGVFVSDWPTHDFHGADRVLLWADAWLAELSRFPAPLPAGSVTGNPKLEWLLSGPAGEAAAHAAAAPGGTQRVLVLGTNGEATRDGQALRLAAAALPETERLRVSFRPHPAEPRENYLSLIREGLLQPHQLDTSQDAYAALRSATLVLGTQSTLLVEAVSLGVPAVQLLPRLFEVDWARRGLASASTEAELAAIAARLLADGSARERALEAARPLAEALFGRVEGAAARAADAIERELDGTGAALAETAGRQVAQPLVTIMIPTYGQAAILGRAIESALAQTYPNLEVVVADDASPDDTAAAVAAYAADPRLRYVRREANLGRTANYRATLAQDARGEFALNLDGDDWLCDPEYVADAMALVRANPELALVFARSTTYLQDSDSYSEGSANRGLPELCDGTELFLRYPEGSVSIPHMTALYRRGLALELGFYEHDVVGSDSVALLLLLPGRRVGFIDRVVGVWRHHASNATWASDLAARRANFVVADLPARSAAATQALDVATLRAWRRRMSVRLGHQALADSIAHGRLGSAALLALEMLAHRPAAAVGALTRLTWRGGGWLLRSPRT